MSRLIAKPLYPALAILSIAIAAVATGLLVGRFPSAAAYFLVAAALVWTIRLRISVCGARLLNPVRSYLPLFVIYNAAAIALAKSPSASYQVLLVVLAGFCFIGGAILPRRATDLAKRPATVTVPSAVIVGLAAVGLGVLTVLISHNGLPLFAADPNAARVSFFPNGYVSTLVVVCLQAVIVVGSVQILDQPRRRWSPIPWLLVPASAVGLFATASRGLVVGPALTVAIYAAWRHRVPILRLLLAIVVVLGAFSYIGYTRNLSSFGYTYDENLLAAGYGDSLRYVAPLASYVAGTSETLDRTISVFPHEIPYQFGTQFFGPLLHKQSTDLYLKQIFGLNFVGFGLALGAINAFYLDWGPVGVGAGFLIFGLVSALLYNRAGELGGRWQLGYAFWLSNLILSNYGHPFAYLSVLILPIVVLALTRSVIQSDGIEMARKLPSAHDGHRPVQQSEALA